jgi:cobalt-zinc-cadmium efflux system protein
MLFVDWYILDPTLSLLITAYVLYNVVGNLKKTLVLFLQGVPSTIDIENVERRLAPFTGH